MYFNGKEFLHYKLAEDLLKHHEVYVDNGKLCIEIDGQITKDEGMIKRLLVEYDRRLRVRDMNEVIRYLKVRVQPIECGIVPTSITPVLLGERVGNSKSVKVWCPYCIEYHYHGYTTEKNEEHRVAHCSKKTPYKNTGYIIRVKE